MSTIRQCRYIPVNGGTLYTESYINPESSASIVMVHGYTESVSKLYEIAWIFLRGGLNVFLLDQRGHGHSLRETDNPHVVHVDSFNDYVEDLHAFINEQVIPNSYGKPLVLYGHSMGGAVSAHYLISHPEVIKKAVLSSPMISPLLKGDMSMEEMLKGLESACLNGKGKVTMFPATPYDPARDLFEDSCATSMARFDFYKQLRTSDEHLQHCGPSISWLYQSIAQRAELINCEKVKQICASVLLCQA